jgi:hypothetical protein
MIVKIIRRPFKSARIKFTGVRNYAVICDLMGAAFVRPIAACLLAI